MAVFHLLERSEIDFTFDRPMRFLDMEGGPAVLADPSLIGREYRRAVQDYLEQLRDVVRDVAVDYHRVSIHQPYDDVLARFLLGRTPKKARR